MYKRGLLKHVFSQIIQYKKLHELCTYKPSNNSYLSISKNNGTYPVYDASGIVKYIDCFDIDRNYISIIKDGAGVGRLQFCQANSSIIGTMGAILPKNCDTHYLYYALQTIDFRKFIIGSTIPHIYFRDYSTVPIPIVNYDKQIEISNTLCYLDKLIDNNICVYNSTISLKEGLLQQMFI